MELTSLSLWFPLTWASFLALANEESPPKGHLQPFGGWKLGVPIDERTDIPEPAEFYEKFNKAEDGWGKPFVMRGAASKMGAFEWTNDHILLERHGNEQISGVEYQLKETRAGGQVPGMNRMKDFLNAYNTSDIYMVSKLSKNMKKDVTFLPCLRCGGFLNYLDVANMWMGRGGSASVIHYDDQDNINCMFVGQKRFVFMHPSYKKKFEAHPNSKKNKFGWVDADLDRSVNGYGGFMGKVNASAMDLIQFPGWRKVDWSYADLGPGDCLYIPYQWYHQVSAAPSRSINIHVWYWRPKTFSEKECKNSEISNVPTFADCSWGFEPENGHLGSPSKKQTKCKKRKKKNAGSSGQEL